MDVDESVRIAGCEAFGIDPGSLHSLGGTDGAVFLCRRGERAHVIKFIPLKVDQENELQEKLQFMHYLAENGVNLAEPLPADNGARYIHVNAGASGDSYAVMLTKHASGITPNAPRTPNEWNELLFLRWGKVAGKMHALARSYPHWQRAIAGGPPSQEAGEGPAPQPATYLNDWQQEYRFFENWCGEPQISKQWAQLCPVLERLPRSRNSYGLIHNDLHQWNFLYDTRAEPGSEITVIDFDVCAYHWFVADIATALYHAILNAVDDRPENRSAFAVRFMRSFMRGYNQENELDPFWLLQLNTFLKYRQILVYVAMSNSWPKGKRMRWQETFLGRMRRNITSNTPVLPQELIPKLATLALN